MGAGSGGRWARRSTRDGFPVRVEVFVGLCEAVSIVAVVPSSSIWFMFDVLSEVALAD